MLLFGDVPLLEGAARVFGNPTKLCGHLNNMCDCLTVSMESSGPSLILSANQFSEHKPVFYSGENRKKKKEEKKKHFNKPNIGGFTSNDALGTISSIVSKEVTYSTLKDVKSVKQQVSQQVGLGKNVFSFFYKRVQKMNEYL